MLLSRGRGGRPSPKFNRALPSNPCQALVAAARVKGPESGAPFAEIYP